MRKRAALLLVLVLCLCACGSSSHSSSIDSNSFPKSHPKLIGHRVATGYYVILFKKKPNGVNCEITAHDGVGTHAYCVQRYHAAPVTGVSLAASGRLSICHASNCDRMNHPLPEVTVGEKVGWPHGPFACTVLSTGVRCIATKTHTGFLIGANGVQRVGHL